jgi:hypothetical protein
MEHINNIEDIYKLSPMQQGMLFHTLYAPDSEVYREQTSCSLKGNLNVFAFQQAWGQVVQRHPILRTAFYWEELSEPLQVVQRQVELSWEQHDWRGLSPKALHGLTAPTPLPIRRSEGVRLEPAPRYAEQGLGLGAGVTGRLRALAREQHLALNTVVQGAWALLLSRYSGEESELPSSDISEDMEEIAL